MTKTAKLWVGTGTITLVSLCIWMFLWRNVYLSFDDLRASLNGGAGIYGASSPAQVWQAIINDYLERNGRVSDGLVKALLSLGYGSWRITGPIILTLMSFTVWLALTKLVNALRRNRSDQHAFTAEPTASITPQLVACAAIALLPLAFVGSQILFGPTLMFFNAAVVGYGLALAFGATGLALYFTSGTTGLPLVRLVLAAALFFTVGVTNEAFSAGIIAMLAVALILPATRHLRIPTLVSLFFAALGFVVFFFSPGRTGRVADVESMDDGILRRLYRGVTSIIFSGGVFGVCVVALTIILIILVLARRETRSELLDLSSPLASGTVILLALAAGSFAIPVFMGLYPGRPYFFGLVFLLVIPFFMHMCNGDSTRTATPSRLGPQVQSHSEGETPKESRRIPLLQAVAVLILLITLAFATLGAIRSERSLVAVAEVWGSAQQQLKDANTLEQGTVVLPGGDAYADDLWSRLVPRTSGNDEPLREWFDIPAEIRLEWR